MEDPDLQGVDVADGRLDHGQFGHLLGFLGPLSRLPRADKLLQPAVENI